MAASLLRCCCRDFLKFKPDVICRHAGYFVLLPETPSDSPETNPLLQLKEYPDYQLLTAKHCYNGLGQLIMKHESAFTRLEEKLQEGNEVKDFSTVIEPLEELEAVLHYAWSTLKTLHAARADLLPSDIYSNLHERCIKTAYRKFNSLPMYHAIKELQADSNKLDSLQKRVVSKYALEGKLNGVDLVGDKPLALQVVLQKLQHHRSTYAGKVQTSTKKFCHYIENRDVVKDFPSSLLKEMASDRNHPSEGPWGVTLAANVYHPFLSYCSNGVLRWNAWLAYHSRASDFQDNILSNSMHIEEMRLARNDQANILGFDNYVQMSMETKMAGTEENVRNMIASLYLKAKPAQDTEIARLEAFANSNGATEPLKHWDLPYWRRIYREKEILKHSEDGFREWFPFEWVFEKLLGLTEQLFGVSIEDCTDSVHTWHPDVRFFVVRDEGDNHKIGSFYIDPFARPEQKRFMGPDGAYTLSGRDRSVIAGTDPYSVMLFNFTPPLYGQPVLLSFNEVKSLFKQVGLCLQDVMTSSHYTAISGRSFIEWDAVLVCGYFMKNWLLEESLLMDISSHHESGDPLPQEFARSIIRADNHMAATDLCHQLYLATYDLDLHTKKDHWNDMMRKLYPEYHTLELDKRDHHPCSFTEIFSGDLAAGYYSNIWTQMLAADLFNCFREAGTNKPERLAKVGKRFRETFLSLGGGCHSQEVFRNFRGRDPSPDALLLQLGLQQLETPKKKRSIEDTISQPVV